MKNRYLHAVAGLIGLAFVGSASAADLPLKAPVIAPAPIGWTGIYIGANVGGGIGTNSWGNFVPPPQCSFLCQPSPTGGILAGAGTTSGVLGGAQLGFNYQTGWVVWGLEGEFDWTGLKGSTPLDTAFPYTLNDSMKTNYIATVTGRVGGVWHQDMLIYFKGGAAFIQNKYDVSVNNLNTGASAGNYPTLTDDRTGWTIGFGTEYRFDPRWSAKIEYDYLEFSSKTLGFATGSGVCCSGSGISLSVPLTVHEFKLGLNYKIW